jgi:hypothetical protein
LVLMNRRTLSPTLECSGGLLVYFLVGK